MKKSIFILCCTLFIFSCSKNKSEPVQNDNQIIENEISDSTTTLNFTELKIAAIDEAVIENENNSFITEQNKEETIAFQIEPITESISKPFIYEFPKIIDFDKVQNYTYSISDFSDEEKLFYEKYVGCYMPERELTKDYLSSHLSEVQVNFIENGIIFWGLCKLEAGVHYIEKEKQFYQYGTFDTWPIKDLSDFKSLETYEGYGYKKFTDCQIIEDIISEKKSKMNRPPLTELQEQNVRNFLKEFFTSLCKKDFDEGIDTFFVSKNDRNKIRSSLYGHKWLLEHESPEFRTYINVFFNDDIDKFDKDTIFVELEIDGIYNYVSFALKEINDELKITNYVVRYNQL